MVLKLAGIIQSPSFQLASVVLNELHVAYEHIPVSFRDRATLDGPAHRSFQPFGQIPYLIDTDEAALAPQSAEAGGFVVYEARAIARYAAIKYGKGTGLIPDWSDVRKVGRFEQAASVELNDWFQTAWALAIEVAWKPLNGAPTDEAAKEKHLATLTKKLAVLDGILAKQRFVAGDELTIVDLFHLPLGTTLQELGKTNLLDVEERPNVARWWKEISTRPSWLAVKAQF